MSDRRRGLGRGLGALIPSAPPRPASPAVTAVARPVDVLFPERPAAVSLEQSPEGVSSGGSETDAAGESDRAASHLRVREPGASYAELPLAAITPNPRQPRQIFDEDAMSELVASIRAVGLLQPVVVRALSGEHYELVMGERRWRAAASAGLDAIPAIVRAVDDDALLRDALLENLHRSSLNPLEEAAAYDQLLQDFGCTHEELALRLGRSRPQISNTLRLLRLSPAVQRRVAAGVLSAGHARALVTLTDPGEQDRLAQRIVAEGLSVRAVEELVALGSREEAGPEPARPRLKRPSAPGLTDLASRLSDRFETRVKVDLGKRKGRIVVEFASLDDLGRIVSLLDPDEAASAAAAEESPEIGTAVDRGLPSAPELEMAPGHQGVQLAGATGAAGAAGVAVSAFPHVAADTESWAASGAGGREGARSDSVTEQRN